MTPPLVEKRWYQRPRVQLGVAATIVVAVVGGYLWAHYTEPSRPWDSDIKVVMLGSVGR